MSKRNLTDPSKGYAVDDSCVFGAEVFVIKTQRVNECLSLIKYASSCKREWKISDFSKLGDVWRSEKFEAGDHYWKVEVYPNGYSSSAKDRYVSIFVNCVDSKKFDPHHKAKAEISISIQSKLNHTHHSRKYYYWFASSFEHGGFPEFIRIADMSSRGLLVDDCCILEVEISLLALALDAPN